MRGFIMNTIYMLYSKCFAYLLNTLQTQNHRTILIYAATPHAISTPVYTCEEKKL